MKPTLRILFLSNRIPFPIVDGQSRRTYNILKGLSKTHEVSLVSLFEETEVVENSVLQHLKTFCKNVELFPMPSKRVSVSMGIRIVRSLFSRDPYTFWRHYSASFRKRVVDLTRTRTFDLIHCDILSVAYAVRSLSGIHCVLTDHDVSYVKAERMAEGTTNPLIKALLYLESVKLKRLEGRIFKEVDAGITVSEVDRKILKELCPLANIVVVENGVDTEEFKPSYEEVEDNVIVWVGGFDNYPNREGIYYFLNKVYPLIKEKLDVKINLVGTGVTQRLKNISSADPSIHMVGYVNDPVPFIQKAAVFVVPILSGSGTRLKLLEAMSSGKAIVTTSVGCEGIEGAHKEHFMIADTPADFAQCVVTVLQNKNLRNTLGVNARKIAIEHYDWNNIYRKMDEIYIGITQQGA